MEKVPNNIEVLKTQITEWFDKRKEKLAKAFPDMSERDLEDVLNVLKSIDSEHSEFNDFVPGSVERKIAGMGWDGIHN